jgi:uncharacterized membrane protein (UPF0127 family)
MSKKQTRGQDAQPKKKGSTGTVAVVGTILLILALVAVLTYQPPKAHVSGKEPVTSSRSSPREFVKQGEVRFMTARQAFIAAVDVELALDEATQQLGLMYRDKLAENQGMLFVFTEDAMRAFWMKNTLLSLDMVFVNGNSEIVTIHKYTKPYSEESYTSTRPAKYVVEVNGGYTDKYKISVGNRIKWTRF